MGDGTKKDPFTSEDVFLMLTEHGWTAQDINLPMKIFEESIDLRGYPLSGIKLQKASLRGAIIEDTHINGAHLEGVDLSFAHLEGADLSFAHLDGADLSFAHLEGADLFSAEFSDDTKLADVEWENHILDERRKWRLGPVENPYRRLKIWYTKAGMYDIAGKFFYREMEAKRKSIQNNFGDPDALLKYIKNCFKGTEAFLKSIQTDLRGKWSLW